MASRFVLRSILVASDLLPGSDAAIRAGASLAARSGARLVVLHALTGRASPYSPREVLRASLHARESEAEQELAGQVERTLPADATAPELRVVQGAVAEVVAREVESLAADVVVIGPHRRPGITDPLLGGTAERLLRQLGVPCLVVRNDLDLPLRRMLAPVDFSEPSLMALRTAVQWGAALHPSDCGVGLPEVELEIVHVSPPSMGASDQPVLIGPELDPRVARVIQGIPGACEVSIREEIIWGDDPARQISAHAGRSGTSLIVLGTRGYGPIGRVLLGSTAARLAREAPCSVLVVPPASWQAPSTDRLSSVSHSS
jgi:universal stress protein E